MSDLNLESLRTLFENLADRLDETSGDEQSVDGLTELKDSLRDLIKEIEKQGSNAATKRKANDFIKDFFSEWQKHDPMAGVRRAIEENGDGPDSSTILGELQQGSKGLGRSRKDLERDMGLFGKMTKKQGDGFSKVLGGATGKLGAFLAVAGGAAAITKGAMAWGAKQIDSYRTLVSSAEGTVGSIQQMNRVALNAGMTVEDLANAMKIGSDGARQLGAVNYAKLNDNVRRATRETGLMGMTLEQINAAQSNYLDILRESGTADQLNQDQMAKGIQDMVKSSDTVATILGKTREEAQAAIKEQMRDRNLMATAIAQGLDPTKVGAALKLAEEQGGEPARAALADMIYTQGAGYFNKDAASAVAVTPELDAITRQAFSDLKGGQDASVALSQNLKNLGNQLAADKQGTATKAFLGNATGENAFLTASTLATVGRSAIDPTTRNAPSVQKDDATVAMLNIEETMKRIETNLQKAVAIPLAAAMDEFGGSLKTGVFAVQDFADKLGGVTNIMDEHRGVTGKVVGGLLAILGPLAVFGSVLNTVTNLKMLRGLGGLGKGAAGAGGARAGQTILGELATKGAGRAGIMSRFMGAGGAAAGGSGLAALALPALAAAGGAFGMFQSGKSIRGHQNESFLGTKAGEGGLLNSRAGGYAGSAASGALAGAAIGSVIPVAGTAVGALVGGGVGLASAAVTDHWDEMRDFFTGKKAQPANASGMKDISSPNLNANMATSRKPGEDGKPQTVKTPIDSMADRLAGLHATTNSHLKNLVDNSNTQINLLREDLSATKAALDQVIKAQDRTTRAVMNGGNLI